MQVPARSLLVAPTTGKNHFNMLGHTHILKAFHVQYKEIYLEIIIFLKSDQWLKKYTYWNAIKPSRYRPPGTRAGRGLGQNLRCGLNKDIQVSVWWLRCCVKGFNTLREEDGEPATGRALRRHGGRSLRRTGNDLEGRGAGWRAVFMSRRAASGLLLVREGSLNRSEGKLLRRTLSY